MLIQLDDPNMDYSAVVTPEGHPPFDNDLFRVQKMRKARNRLLSECDWTQMADNQLDDAQRAAWQTYRQTLRDFPTTWTPGPTVEFPDPPTP